MRSQTPSCRMCAFSSWILTEKRWDKGRSQGEGLAVSPVRYCVYLKVSHFGVPHHTRIFSLPSESILLGNHEIHKTQESSLYIDLCPGQCVLASIVF